MISLAPWDDDLALEVLRGLDVNDRLECALWRGDDAAPLAMWADWRGAAIGTLIATADGRPFALLTMAPTGAAGVASVAMLARDHRRWRAELRALALHWRRRLPGWCAERGVVRAECRSWAEHPSAARFIRAVGLEFEARLTGYAGGRVAFDQYAWTAPQPPEED